MSIKPTRRGGRCHYARELFFRYKYQPVSKALSDSLGTDRVYTDPEYEAFFQRAPRAQPPTLRKDIKVKTIEPWPTRWPKQLTPITIEHTISSLPPLQYHPLDPRQHRYLQIREERFHEIATPPREDDNNNQLYVQSNN